MKKLTLKLGFYFLFLSSVLPSVAMAVDSITTINAIYATNCGNPVDVSYLFSSCIGKSLCSIKFMPIDETHPDPVPYCPKDLIINYKVNGSVANFQYFDPDYYNQIVEFSASPKPVVWNLSMALARGILKNPNGPWEFLETATSHQTSLYSRLPNYSSPCVYNDNSNITMSDLDCWEDLSVVGVKPKIGVSTKSKHFGNSYFFAGSPYIQPTSGHTLVLRWKSPISGDVVFSGTVSDMDPGCGDGIKWSLDKNAETLNSGVIYNGFGANIKQDVTVVRGDSLYLLIESGGTQACDMTSIDVIIAKQLLSSPIIPEPPPPPPCFIICG